MKQSHPSPISTKAENRASCLMLQTSSLLRQGISSFSSSVLSLLSMTRLQMLPEKAGAMASLCLLMTIVLGDRLVAATPSPPPYMAFQSYLTDDNGDPVGRGDKPENKTIIFTIYDADTDGNIKWSEEQIVTVNNGHFSVILGEGTPKFSIPEMPPVLLSNVFSGNDASDRFIELTLVNDDAGGGNQVLLPRLRLMPSAYAFMASKVVSLNLSDNNVIVGQLEGSKIKPASITGNQIANGTITTGNIKDGAITTGDIQDGAITTGDIQDGTITTYDILNGTITQNDLGNGTIINSELTKRLRIVRGFCDGGANGNWGSGNYKGTPGWSVNRTSTGEYTITFDPPFTNMPTVTVTPYDYKVGDYELTAVLRDVKKNSVKVKIKGPYTSSGFLQGYRPLENGDFMFIAIGD
jgi:hypothetical protein